MKTEEMEAMAKVITGLVVAWRSKLSPEALKHVSEHDIDSLISAFIQTMVMGMEPK